MAEEKKNWYVLRAISGKETKVKELLDAAKKNPPLAGNLFEVLIPTEKVYTTRNGKKVLKEKTMFSGYVFVNANLRGDVEDYLRNTTNVIDFVRSREAAHRPEPIRDVEVQRMLGAAEAESALLDPTGDYIVGEAVKVMFGPFSGFIGEIEEVFPEKRKLKVSVRVFGRKTPLELDNSQVERE